MSRAYRIVVKDSLQRVVRSSDHVSTQLGILEVLPPEQMAELLADELARRGFQRCADDRGTLTREIKGVRVVVDVATGTVTAQTEAEEKLDVSGELEGYVAEESNKAQKEARKEALRQEVLAKLQQEADRKAADLQGTATEKLAATLGDLKKELDQVVNRVTAEALKRKAASIGQIKEVTEDPKTGSMTIVLEV